MTATYLSKNPELQRLREARRSLLRAMKEQGIPRRSFMNGGLSDIAYRCNADLFSINCAIKRITEAA